jgi:hypothetical protein
MKENKMLIGSNRYYWTSAAAAAGSSVNSTPDFSSLSPKASWQPFHPSYSAFPAEINIIRGGSIATAHSEASQICAAPSSGVLKVTQRHWQTFSVNEPCSSTFVVVYSHKIPAQIGINHAWMHSDGCVTHPAASMRR